VIRQATLQAMRILGGQFVFGRTIDEALKRAAPERKEAETHTLRHARRGGDDLRRRRALPPLLRRRDRAAGARAGEGCGPGPGISVKLSALYPKYDFSTPRRPRRR
jgi:RHH-type proline utilization regulon transcriptional repressor/proline dehydrogenase/delta 1-pyrroline-5-carboxylate dehydrogenase